MNTEMENLTYEATVTGYYENIGVNVTFDNGKNGMILGSLKLGKNKNIEKNIRWEVKLW
jgi:hypothetical protein